VDDGVLRYVAVSGETICGAVPAAGVGGGAAPDVDVERRQPTLELIYLGTEPYRS
jgi:hypothetical protein